MSLQVFDAIVYMIEVTRHFRLQRPQVLDLRVYVAQMLTKQFAELFKHGVRRSVDSVDSIEVADFLQRQPHLFEPLDETEALNFVRPVDSPAAIPASDPREQS